jgi:hypothetical protein
MDLRQTVGVTVVRHLLDSAVRPSEVRMHDDTDENPARPWSGRRRWHPRVLFFLVGGVAEGYRHLRRSLVVLVLSPAEILDSKLDRRDGGVLGVVSLLGVSRLETWLGCTRLLSSGAHRCPRLLSRGAMNAIADDSKARLPRYCLSSSVYLL